MWSVFTNERTGLPFTIAASPRQLYQLYHDDDIVKYVKLCRLRWAGHVMCMSENDPAKKVLMLGPGGI
jgi:hypothetical protein